MSTCSQVAPPALWHEALYRPGYVTQGTGPGCRKYGASAPVPPPMAAGLTHATSWPAAVNCNDSRLTPEPGRPNSASGGGGAPKVEYAMAQPSRAADVHSGMFLKVAPTVFPSGTWRLPPARMAVTMWRRTDGLGSICSEMSLMSMAAPCEWPMRM